ncbi:WecB/TagA/CpsF family glycosyltransferase [bacterium]|nr:WecB/TagA/CpsF family glycosyltransferase [bacterium]MBU1993798.1 WecB/TagA/CpsF family glycosyltransferase [bacterium]
MNKKKVVDILISKGTYDEFLSNILNLALIKVSSYVCVSNVHMTIESYNDESFCDIVNNADIATPDGMPLAKAMNFLYNIKQDRVAGMDLMPDLMQECERFGKSIYLYGSTDEILKKITDKAKNEFPDLSIASYSPPFRALDTSEKVKIIEKINSFNPDFVFVALGCPKQEKWMAEHKGKINSCMIGLGGALEVYADVKGRAPKWMQDYSLEWVFRLVQDPKRLWKRYLYTNSLFIILFIKQFISQKFKK